MLERVPKIQEKSDAVPFEYRQGGIELQNVTFGHKLENKDDESQNYLFKNLSLKIEPGSTNAIVGPSGFGKTTILHLLFRMYDPEQGSVLIDGQDVKNLKLDSFRQYISVIP